MKTAVFAGTFDPVTTGHEYIVNKCLEEFDKVVVVVADNDKKQPVFSSEQRRDFILKVFKENDRVEVKIHHGLMMDFMKNEGYVYYVRGVRDDKDLEYEDKMKAFNQSIYPSLKTVYYKATDEFKKINSTSVRNGQIANLSEALPSAVKDEILRVLKQK